MAGGASQPLDIWTPTLYRGSKGAALTSSWVPTFSRGLRRRLVVKRGWSFRFFPSSGRSLMTGIESLESSILGPIPERRRVFGESIAPAERITSFAAV